MSQDINSLYQGINRMQEYIRTLETMTKNIKECLACASTWYDDGFTAECPQCRVRRLEEENRNHKQTLAGIAAMNPAEEGDRAIQWAKDGLSGYTMPVDATVKYLQDRVRELENALERVRAERDTAQEACDAELTEQHDRFEDRERGLKDTVDALDARVRELEATLTHEQADNDRLEQELAKEREARADLVRRVEEVAQEAEENMAQELYYPGWIQWKEHVKRLNTIVKEGKG